jgi:hypothetical protein
MAIVSRQAQELHPCERARVLDFRLVRAHRTRHFADQLAVVVGVELGLVAEQA